MPANVLKRAKGLICALGLCLVIGGCGSSEATSGGETATATARRPLPSHAVECERFQQYLIAYSTVGPGRSVEKFNGLYEIWQRSCPAQALKEKWAWPERPLCEQDGENRFHCTGYRDPAIEPWTTLQMQEREEQEPPDPPGTM
jgi:hypothetical protein